MKLTNKNKSKGFSFLYYLPVFLLLWLPVTVIAENESEQARKLINQMTRASHELNYDGVFVYRRGKHMDMMRIIHKADEDGEYERMVSLTGYAREIIRDKKSVTCIFPDDQAVIARETLSEHGGTILQG